MNTTVSGQGHPFFIFGNEYIDFPYSICSNARLNVEVDSGRDIDGRAWEDLKYAFNTYDVKLFNYLDEEQQPFIDILGKINSILRGEIDNDFYLYPQIRFKTGMTLDPEFQLYGIRAKFDLNSIKGITDLNAQKTSQFLEFRVEEIRAGQIPAFSTLVPQDYMIDQDGDIFVDQDGDTFLA